MKLFRPLAVSIILCWWYPPADTGIGNSGNSWCVLDFLAYIPNAIGSYTHDLYEAEASQISDRYEEVQGLIYVRDTLYQNLQAQADVARTGTSDPNLVEATMENAGVDEVTAMEKDASKLWFTSLTAGAIVGLDKIIMLIALIVFRVGWWSTIYCQQILLGMLTIFGPIQWAFSLLPKWEGAWAKWLIRYLTVHFYGAMLYFVGFYVLLLFDIVLCIQVDNLTAITASEATMAAFLKNAFFSAGYLMAATCCICRTPTSSAGYRSRRTTALPSSTTPSYSPPITITTCAAPSSATTPRAARSSWTTAATLPTSRRIPSSTVTT